MNKETKAKDFEIDQLTDYIRFFFSVFVLGFISIIITGKLLTKIPACNIQYLKGSQFMKFNIGIVKLEANDGEVIVGLASYICIVLLVGSCIGKIIHDFFNNNFGTNLTQFEAICIFSAFCSLFISFILVLLHPKRKENLFNDKYDSQIDKLSNE